MREITAHDVNRMAEPDRERVLDWVRSHGFDPDNTFSVRCVGPWVEAKVYVLNEQGRIQLDPQDRNEPLMRTRLVRRRRPLVPQAAQNGGGVPQ